MAPFKFTASAAGHGPNTWVTLVSKMTTIRAKIRDIVKIYILAAVLVAMTLAIASQVRAGLMTRFIIGVIVTLVAAAIYHDDLTGKP